MWRIRIINVVRKLYHKYLMVKQAIQKLFFRLNGGARYGHKHVNVTLAKALEGQHQQTDISDHLGLIFYFAVDASPRLIVELGTRGGDSTCALLAAASVVDASVLSIDIDDCKQINVPYKDRWHFVKSDDVEFGKTRFKKWCSDHAIDPIIDVLFVDTSHEYGHTKKEIEVWGEYLSEQGTMVFHDTNMGKGMYARNDGSIDFGWDNKRGVIRALEDLLGCEYDEKAFFCDVTDAFNLIHFPNCNGLTVLKKVNKPGRTRHNQQDRNHLKDCPKNEVHF